MDKIYKKGVYYGRKTIQSNFIRNIVINDLETGKHNKIILSFPGPNGYLQ